MKLTIEHNKSGWKLSAYEEERFVATGGGATIKEAARWLVHHVNRIAEATENAVQEAGFLTDDELLEAAGGGSGDNLVTKLAVSP